MLDPLCDTQDGFLLLEERWHPVVVLSDYFVFAYDTCKEDRDRERIRARSRFGRKKDAGRG